MQKLVSRFAGGEEPRLEARYMSLGDVGHAFPADMPARMCEAIAWVRRSTCKATGP